MKMAVLMPMPRAKAAIAAKVNPGFARNMRTACLRLSQKSLMRSIRPEWGIPGMLRAYRYRRVIPEYSVEEEAR